MVLVKGFKEEQLLLVCPKFLFVSLKALNVPSDPSKDHHREGVGVDILMPEMEKWAMVMRTASLLGSKGGNR